MHSRGLYVQTENESSIDILMVTPEGKETWIFKVDPVKDLMAAIEIDYSEYCRRITQLHNLPLFQEKLDIAMWEYEELVNTVKKMVFFCVKGADAVYEHRICGDGKTPADECDLRKLGECLIGLPFGDRQPRHAEDLSKCLLRKKK